MGTPITPEIARRIAEVFQRRPEVDAFECKFLNSLRERFGRYGLKTHMSDKQAAILDRIYVSSSDPFGGPREGGEIPACDDVEEGDFVPPFLEDDIPF